MNYLLYKEVYNQNKSLDQLFINAYGNSNEIITKNKLELLVELGELANESKCFKYWSKKSPDKNLVLEEYADCLLMIFYFMREFDIELNETFPNTDNNNIIDQFLVLYKLTSNLLNQYTKELIKEIFVQMINLGKLLNLSDKEIIASCFNKIKIDKQRFEIDY